jgi:hypothetical protein
VRARPALGALVLALSAGAPLRADVLHLTDGGRIEGRILARGERSVTIDTRFGRQEIERRRIARIELGRTPAEELARLEAEAEGAGAAKWWEIAEFAAKSGLRKDRARLIDKVLALDPEHEAANVAKGRVKHDGRFMTPAERDELVARAERERLRERGLVEHEGRFVTPEEKEHLEQGHVQVDGKWMTPDQAREAQGLVRVGGEWVAAAEELALRRALGFSREASVALAVAKGDHVVAASAFGKEPSETLRDTCEAAYAAAVASLEESSSDLAWVGGQKLLAVVLPERADFALFTAFFARDEKRVDQRWSEGVARSDGFYWWDPTGTSATFKGGRHLEHTTAHTIHHLGHVLLNRHAYNFKFLPTWLDEGYAAWLEHSVLKRNLISCISGRRYGAENVRKEDLLARASWWEDAVQALAAGRDAPFFPVLRRDLSTITPDEVSKSMLVIEWMVQTRRAEFLRLLAALRESWPAGLVSPLSPEARSANARAFEALGVPAEKVDAELRAWLAPAAKKDRE